MCSEILILINFVCSCWFITLSGDLVLSPTKRLSCWSDAKVWILQVRRSVGQCWYLGLPLFARQVFSYGKCEGWSCHVQPTSMHHISIGYIYMEPLKYAITRLCSIVVQLTRTLNIQDAFIWWAYFFVCQFCSFWQVVDPPPIMFSSLDFPIFEFLGRLPTPGE